MENKHSPSPGVITVVSGLPRSGTSMMMRMLEAGGMPVLVDHFRTADESNPKGYYEYERVKKLKQGDTQWVELARGKAVKVISVLLEVLPPQYEYRIIFMQRSLDEVLASQRRMLLVRGEAADKVNDEQMADLFQKHLVGVMGWLSRQANMRVLYVDYNSILADPQPWVSRIVQFLSQTPLDEQSMLGTIEHSLYRQRQVDVVGQPRDQASGS